MGQVFGRDAGASIRHRDSDAITIIGQTQSDFAALRCVMQGIVEKVAHHLCGAVRVCPRRRQVRRRLQRHPDLLGCQLTLEPVDDLL